MRRLFVGGVYFDQHIRWCSSVRWCCRDSDEKYPFSGLEENEDELEYTETVLEVLKIDELPGFMLIMILGRTASEA